MTMIKKIHAREVLDSKGFPTIEVDILTSKGLSRAIVPSGVSKGEHEVLELRDGGRRFLGLGVMKGVKNVNKIIAKKIVGMDCKRQRDIDNKMIKLDGTRNKKRLGANAILGVSMAVCKAGANDMKLPLYKYIGKIAKNKRFRMPSPQILMIEGGEHAGNNLDFQEYMITPVIKKKKGLKESLRVGTEIYQLLKQIIRKRYGKNAINVGYEGGFAPPLKDIEEPLRLIMKAAEKLGYAKRIGVAIDCAASFFYKKGSYKIEGKKLSSEKLLDLYIKLHDDYPITSIEDGFAQDDWCAWTNMMDALSRKIRVVGDDLLCTNIERIKKAIKLNACNSLLLKINQIGTISESIDAALLAQKKWSIIVSQRAGETEDPFIADIAVGLSSDCKFGAPARSERTAKYNELLRIEEMEKQEFDYE